MGQCERVPHAPTHSPFICTGRGGRRRQEESVRRARARTHTTSTDTNTHYACARGEGWASPGQGGPAGGKGGLRNANRNAVLEEKEHQKKERFVATETNGHGDALCFMVKTWARHKTTETVLNNGWRLAVGGSWR